MTGDLPVGSRDESAWERRRLLDRLFGEVLPEVTADEALDPADRTSDRDDWLRAQLPPHHG